MNNKIFLTAFLFISGCTIDPSVKDSAPQHVPVNVMAVPDAVPRHEKRTRAGNPQSYEVLGRHYQVLADSKGYRKRGIASWYGTKFHGKKTSNGEVYDMYAMTAAHKTLPIPCYVKVTNLQNQRNVIVRINDRGPFHENRIIDLSYTAAVKLGIQQYGTGLVEVEAIDPGLQPAITLRDKSKEKENNKLFLQVGAFTNQLNARQLQQKVAGITRADSRLKVSQSSGDTLYKVQIGPVASVELADQLYEQLVAIGISGGTLVRDD